MVLKFGFTLVELLIAASIAALLGLAIVATFAAGFKTYSALKNSNLAEAETLLAFENIAQDLKNTFHFQGIYFKGDKTSVAFAGFLSHSTQIGKIGYTFDAQSTKALFKTQQPYSDALFNHLSQGLDTHGIAFLKDLSFSYYGLNASSGQYGWNDVWDNKGAIPLEVKVRAVFQEGNANFEREKTIRIPIAG